jgi:hypothetical protein
MSEPREITREVLAAMGRYERAFGKEYPVGFMPEESADEIIAEIERRIREKDPAPEEFEDVM